MFEAVNAITGRYPAYRAKMTPAPSASVEAAVASATRNALSRVMPTQQAAIDADYQAQLAVIPDGPETRLQVSGSLAPAGSVAVAWYE